MRWKSWKVIQVDLSQSVFANPSIPVVSKIKSHTKTFQLFPTFQRELLGTYK